MGMRYSGASANLLENDGFFERFRKLRSELFMRQFTEKATPLDIEKYERLTKIGVRPEPISADAWKFWRKVKKEAGIMKMKKFSSLAVG